MNGHDHTTIRTEDGCTLRAGEHAFNYYDRKAGTIGVPDSLGWFDFIHEDGTRAYLDGSRICTTAYAIRQGWHMTCHYCGTVARIHRDSLAQYGEPVCMACYAASFTNDGAS